MVLVLIRLSDGETFHAILLPPMQGYMSFTYTNYENPDNNIYLAAYHHSQ